MNRSVDYPSATRSRRGGAYRSTQWTSADGTEGIPVTIDRGLMQIPGDPHSGPDGTVDDLAGLRAALDEVDFRLLDAVRDRVELCRRVGAVKARTDVPVVQPGRMDLVHRRAREYAEDNGLSTAFVDRLFDLLIDEACRVEDTVTGTGSRPREDGGPR